MPERAVPAAKSLQHNLVGCTASQFVAQLPRLIPDVESYTFTRYAPKPGIDVRASHEDLSSSPFAAELHRLKSVAPELFAEIPGLWTAIAAITKPRNSVIAEMLQHNESAELAREFNVDTEWLEKHGVDPLIRDCAQDEVLALSSICRRRNGESVHMVLLDFHVPVSPSNLTLVSIAASELGVAPGVILESGRSYHVYGLKVLSEAVWLKTMVRALLLSPLVDMRYVAHRLLAGRGVLRIGTAPSKTTMPIVSAMIGGFS